MPLEFIRDVVARLEELGIVYAITGSMASSFWGIPRSTHDVDVLVVLSPADAGPVAAAFPEPYYVNEQAVRQAISSKGMFNIIDPASGFKADLWVTVDDPFNRSTLARRQRVRILPGLDAFVGSPEDLMLQKLLWHRMAASERQLADAAGIAVIQAEKLDLDYLRDWAGRQATTELLEDVLRGKYLKNT